LLIRTTAHPLRLMKAIVAKRKIGFHLFYKVCYRFMVDIKAGPKMQLLENQSVY
jgi:hypothetical protein